MSRKSVSLKHSPKVSFLVCSFCFEEGSVKCKESLRMQTFSLANHKLPRNRKLLIMDSIKIVALLILLPSTSGIQVRLVGGRSILEGRVEIYYRSVWGTVCDDSFDNDDASVICYMLGHQREDATAYGRAQLGGRGYGKIWLAYLLCNGTESTVNDCFGFPWGYHNCDHSQDAGVRCQPNVRLIGGSNDYEGRIEVYISGSWGTVCDDSFGNSDARVFCYMLGFNRDGAVAKPEAYFGAGSGTIWLDDLACSGSETSIDACDKNSGSWGSHNCGHGEDAGVVCRPKSCPALPLVRNGRYSPSSCTTSSVNAGQVCRLICNTGYKHSSSYSYSRCSGTGSWSVSSSLLSCSESCPALPLVRNGRYSPSSCTTSSVIAGQECRLICNTGYKHSSLYSYSRCSGTGSWSVSSSLLSCSEGCPALPLVRNGRYSPSSCTTLGVSPGRVCRLICNTGYKLSSSYGYSRCSGTGSWSVSSRLLSCSDINECGAGTSGCAHTCVNTKGSYTCSCRDGYTLSSDNKNCNVVLPFYITNIICPLFLISVLDLAKEYTEMYSGIRLVGGSSELEGRVEVYYNSKWGTVCDDSFDNNDAKVICHMLGYQRDDAVAKSEAYYGAGSGTIWLDDLDCSGSETSVDACGKKSGSWGSHNCGHREDAGVVCLPSIPIRLEAGSSELEGRIEIYYNSKWGTVCDDSFDNNDAKVICYMLGYQRDGAVAKSEAYFGPGSGTIWLDDLDCSGSETSIDACSKNSGRWGAHNCGHGEDAGVVCQPKSCLALPSVTNGRYSPSSCTGSGVTAGQECRLICNTGYEHAFSHNCTRCTGTGSWNVSSSWLTCSDINECTIGISRCAQTCWNTNGSYYCSCRKGYRLTSDSKTCNDIDECTSGTSGCTQTCSNTDGSYKCSCYKGYTLAYDSKTCVDINECIIGISRCAQTCSNTNGSYYCSCTEGYILTSDSQTCNDIDECTSGTSGCTQTCSNSDGSYQCSCNKGYTLAYDSKTCIDFDECLAGLSGCTQFCSNTDGSYKCSCTENNELASDSKRCIDIDECNIGTSGCSQFCSNTYGSYKCGCLEGYVLASDRKTCNDIDECTWGTSGCTETCSNTDGSYECSCNEGYTLAFDRKTCGDIDECLADLSGCTQFCSNTDGSYECSCFAGYVLAADSKTCILQA